MPAPNNHTSVLFVCTGNTCRSPMAAAWFKHLCDEAGIDYIDVDSAGLATRPRDSVSSKARAILAENDLIPLRLGSQLISPKQIFSSDLIITMTVAHQEALVARHPSTANKCRPLLTVLGRRGDDVFDPYGGSLRNYRDCLDMMKPALAALLERIR